MIIYYLVNIGWSIIIAIVIFYSMIVGRSVALQWVFEVRAIPQKEQEKRRVTHMRLLRDLSGIQLEVKMARSEKVVVNVPTILYILCKLVLFPILL